MKKTHRNLSLLNIKISSAFLLGKSFLFIILLSVVLLFQSGCNDAVESGLNLLPNEDQINTVYSDTATVASVTVVEDTLRADELSVQLLGSDNSSTFGKSIASVYTQVNLEGTPAFGFQPVADSLVLILNYSGYYGDTSGTQTVNAYRLTEDMATDSEYYSNRTFTYDPAQLGSISFSPMPNTDVVVDSDTIAPHIRILLSQSLANDIIALNGQSTLSSNAEWLAYFKGIYLEATGVTYPGAISYFDFFFSKLTLYFHGTDQVSKNYNFSLTGARVNHFSHDFSGSEAGLQLNDPNAIDSVNFIQSMAGLKTKITFPYLKHFLDSGSIAINRAELTIPTGEVTQPYSLPNKTFLVTTSDAGEMIFPIDYYESTTYYGGDLNSSTLTYTFNIARQLQRYLDGTVSNADFYLIIASSGVEATRAKIKSGKNIDNRMKLSIFYTKIN